MEDLKGNWENMPARIVWQEEVEYYPIYVNKQTFNMLKRIKRPDLVSYCINNIIANLDNTSFSIDRQELLEQIDDLFDAMGDKQNACNSFLLLVRLNRIVEGV